MWSAERLKTEFESKPTYARRIGIGKDGAGYVETGNLRIDERDSSFLVKSLIGLTIIRGSYEGFEVVDEKGLKELNGGKGDFPPGIYALGPNGKVAAAFEGRLAGEDAGDEKDIDIEALLKEAGLAEQGMWTSKVWFDERKFMSTAEPFADYMMSKDRSKGLETCGMRIESRASGWDMSTSGYPAPIKVSGDWGRREEEDEELPGRARCGEASIGLKALGGLPMWNHNAASPINNTRDILSVEERADARKEIVAYMAREWFQGAALRAGLRDDSLSFPKKNTKEEAEEAKRRIREKEAARAEGGAELGKPRVVFFNPSRTTEMEGGGTVILMTADAALVDGQHSSRDYRLLAEGFEGVMPKEDGKAVLDCAPEVLWKTMMLEAERLADGMSEEERGKLGFARKGAKGKEREQSGEKIKESFLSYLRKRKAKVEFRGESDPKMARERTIMENSQRSQSKDDMALAAEHERVSELVEAFNREAARRGESQRLSGVKSPHDTEKFSACDGEHVLPIKRIFRALFAVASPDGSMAMKSDLENREAEARVMARADVKDLKLEGAAAKEGEERYFAAYMSLGMLKSRGFELSSDRIEKVHRMLMTDGMGRKFSKFSKLLSKAASVFLGEEVAFGEEGADARIYAAVKAAERLAEATNLSGGETPEEIRGNMELMRCVSQSTVESVIYRLVVDNFRPDRKESHPFSDDTLAGVKAAMKRMRERALAGDMGQINAPRDGVAERIRKADGILRGFIAEDENAASLLFDVIPRKGMSFEEARASRKEGAKEEKADAQSKPVAP